MHKKPYNSEYSNKNFIKCFHRIFIYDIPNNNPQNIS